MKKLLIISVLLMLQACTDKQQQATEFIESMKKTQGIAIEPIPKTQEFIHFAYGASNIRSPFVAPQQELTQDVVSEAKDCLQPDIKRQKSTLESYALDNLSMRGSLGDDQQLWALIQTIDGDVFKVKQGYYVGLFHGRIDKVTEQQIDLTEIVPDGTGCWIERNNAIILKEIIISNNLGVSGGP